MTTSPDTASTEHDYEVSDWAALLDGPVISVLMLAYNHGAYLAQAIEGVLAQQTDFPIELLIGEDCSTDDTRAVALRYQAAYPQTIRIIGANHNVGMHRNGQRLIEASRGNLIAFCEGDDYWTDPQKLRLQVGYLRTHPEAGAVHSDFDHVLAHGGQWRVLTRFQKRTRGEIPEGVIFEALLAGNFIQTCTLCVRAALAREYLTSKLPIDSYAVGDWPLCLYISARHKIGYLDRSMAVYRKVPGSAMHGGDLKRLSMVTSYALIIDDMCAYFGTQSSVRNAAHTSLYHSLSKLAFLADDLPTFEKCDQWLSTHAPRLHARQRQLLHWAMKRGPARSVIMCLIMLRRHLNEMLRYRSIK